MSKKFRIILIAVILVIFIIVLFPIPSSIKDGGSIAYISLVYEVVRYHRPSQVVSEYDELHTIYLEGWRIQIFGHIIYDDGQRIYDEQIKNLQSVYEYRQSHE